MRNPIRLLAAVLLLASCVENPTHTLPDETSLVFSYRLGTGEWQNFAADGQQAPGTSFSERGPWVFTGSSGPPHSTLVVSAYQQGENGAWINFLTYVPNVATIDSIFLGDATAGTCPGANSPCTHALFRVENATGNPLETCVVVNGEIDITRRTAQWVSGEFSGTGTCRVAGTQRPFEVRGGTFDIALPPPGSPAG